MSEPTTNELLAKIRHLRSKVAELEHPSASDNQTELALQLLKFQALYDLAVAMSAERSLDENLSLVVNTSRKLLNTDTSYIALRDESERVVKMHTLSGIRTPDFVRMHIPYGEGLGGKVTETGKGFIVKDYFKETGPLLHEIVHKEGLISGVAVPIISGTKVLGVLYAFNRSYHNFTQSDLDTLSLLGNLAAIEISREQNRTEIRAAHLDLENRVQERTAQLMLMNQKLSDEISKRKIAQTALIESEIRYRTLIESAADAIYILDAGEKNPGRIVSANKTASELHGFSVEELLTMNIADLDSPNSPKSFLKRLDQLFNGKNFVEEVYLKKKNGTIFPVEINARLLRIGSNNYILAIHRDITERKKNELLLRESEERMRSVITWAPIGIGIAKNWRYIYVNPAFVRLFGYENSEQVIGRRIEELFLPIQEPQIKQTLEEKQFDQGSPTVYELTGVKSDGETFDLTIRLTMIPYEDEWAMLGFLTDESEEKKLRAQLLQSQKMEAIGTLAGGIAHDFNNLLQIVLGHAELMLINRDLEDLIRTRSKVIKNAAIRGIDLVKRMLAFSRKAEPRLQPLDLNTELVQIENLLRRTLTTLISVELYLDPNLLMINADPIQFEQTILNLAVNAKHAMPEGGKLILETRNVYLDEKSCKIRPQLHPGQHVLLMVSDTGTGMPKKILNRIFEPFFTTKEPGEGTGLGLSMVFGIITSHGGYVYCYSEPGVGTTFKIYFPVMPNQIGWMADTTMQMPAFGTETIMLVDDDDSIRNLGSELLTEVGYRVITAADGQQALNLYSEKKAEISLVILDLIMPQMTGTHCLEQLRRINPEVKVLIASGYSLNGAGKNLVQADINGFIEKPYNLKQILTAVRNALNE